ncbi:MAG: 50S ribosomal protein L7/L12 [Candidatus Nealsonbacteria bacterium]|nr:50S ribosomal protein L7/L12 [Candidatus Nealsonbacteria bacterium]
MTEEKIEEKKDPEKSADADNKVEVPKKFEDIVKKIEEMSVLDLSELVKILEKKFGVSAAAPVAMVAAGGAAPAAAAAEEKTVFNIELTGAGEKKIDVIKVVRDAIGKGLKEAKDLVDAVASGPQVIKENVKKEEAEEIKKKFEAAGAKIELK